MGKRAVMAAIVLGVLLLAPLSGCSGKGSLVDQDAGDAISAEIDPVPPEEDTPPEPDAYAFDAQYVRTDGYHEDVEYPVITVIRSKAELDAYYEANKDGYAMEQMQDGDGFLDACSAYDDEFFNERDLILILLEEPSGSIRHEVSDIRRDYEDGGWRITIDRLLPGAGTDDMAEWHIFASIRMGKVVQEGEEINVVLRDVEDVSINEQ